MQLVSRRKNGDGTPRPSCLAGCAPCWRWGAGGGTTQGDCNAISYSRGVAAAAGPNDVVGLEQNVPARAAGLITHE